MPQQVITSQIPNPTAEGEDVSVEFIYNTVPTAGDDPAEGEALSAGLDVALYYNSSEVSFVEGSFVPGPEDDVQGFNNLFTITTSDQEDGNDGDDNPETDRRLTVNFADTTGATFPLGGDPPFTTGYVQGEDVLFEVAFTQNSLPATIDLIQNGETPGFEALDPITVNLLNEDGEPTSPTVNLSIDPSEGTEADGTTFTLTAETSEAVTGEQTVDLALSGDADADDFVGDLPAGITIADGQTTGTVNVTVNDDDVEEGEETATFTISNPTDGIELGDTVEASATIADNDAVEPTEPTVELSVDPTEGSEEGETVFTFTATASEAVTGEQTVDLALSGDADAEDFVGDLPAAITIADGETTGTVNVTVNDDDVEEVEETANFALENPPEGFVLGANTNVDITIEDNDAPPAELQGDFNDDGITNLDDLGLFAAAFGSAEGDANYNPAVELTGDTSIDNNDLGQQLATFFAEEFAV